jgi:hypothetical protein
MVLRGSVSVAGAAARRVRDLNALKPGLSVKRATDIL